MNRLEDSVYTTLILLFGYFIGKGDTNNGIISGLFFVVFFFIIWLISFISDKYFNPPENN